MKQIPNANIRAAIGYLGWSQKELATRSGLSEHTVGRALGAEKRTDRRRIETIEKMVKAIKATGYKF